MTESAPIRPVEDLIGPKVAQAIAELDLEDRDQAAAQLAAQYAQEIDRAKNRAATLDSLGPKLLACLVELGATPRARKAATGNASPASSPLARLRDSRAG